jgi:hypothetical protein
MIDVETADVGRDDEHPATGVPRLRLAINDCTSQLDVDGSWVKVSPYPKLTVLDHIAEATKPLRRAPRQSPWAQGGALRRTCP